MDRRNFRTLATLFALVAGCTVTACGGGAGSAPPSGTTPSPAPAPAPAPGPAPAPEGAPLAVDCTHTGSGADYRVGPGQTYAALGQVPWESLNPGDTVRVFHRDQPYREKVLIARSGTAAQPIRVCGVPGPQGQLPVLSADGATTRAQLRALFGAYGADSMQQRGLVVIWGPRYESLVEHVHVEGLRLQDVMHAPYRPQDMNSFIDADGSTRAWDDGGAGIRIQRARNLVIRGNAFAYNPAGLYIISQAYAENFMVRNVLIEGNRFERNGLLDDYNKHQAYVQGTNFTIQYNWFGQLTPGAQANNLKMRTAGDVVRYNYFENGARALDMVDIEDFVELVMPWQYARFKAENHTGTIFDAGQAADWEAYRRSHVYGNLFHVHGDEAWPNPIHYGYDNSPLDRRPGSLWFYHNTLLYQTDRSVLPTVRLFDCCSDFTESFYGSDAYLAGGSWHYRHGGQEWGPIHAHDATSWPVMQAHNNAIVLASASPGAAPSAWEFTRWKADRLNLGRNWITAHWNTPVPATGNTASPGFGIAEIPASVVYPGGNASHHVSGMSQLQTGIGVPIDPATFRPVAGSPLLGQALPLPAEIPAGLRPQYQIRLVPGSAGKLEVLARPALTTLGAQE